MPLSHYDVLQLARSSSNLHPEAVKVAYRTALLTHHPDRSQIQPQPQQFQSPDNVPPTIDEIVLAYKVLSDDKLRAEYDQSQAQAARQQELLESVVEHGGIQSYDLEDLNYEGDDNNNNNNEEGRGQGGGGTSSWFRSCRCGKEKGYVITEADLEAADQQQQGLNDNSQQKEILVGCQGCSLVIRVTFATDPG